MDDLKLCYVSGPWAYFTTAAIKDQWGDDWEDAPYEHNAGRPYAWNEAVEGKNGVPSYTIAKIAWEGPFEEPRDGHLNSPYSVRMINRGDIAWLRPESWTTGVCPIHAGTSLNEFIMAIRDAGGTVYLPQP